MEEVTRAQVDSLKWWHSIDFGNGTITKGLKSLAGIKAEADVIFKHGIVGKSVIDIGAWDGAFSFEAKRRGAGRVLATDYFCWTGPGWGKKLNFDLAKQALGLDVEDMVIDVPDISREQVGEFDVVLFLGVLYHLKNPFAGLEGVSNITKELLVIDTETALDTLDRPAMAFFPGSELGQDPTNWWAPNLKCLEGMLKNCGFKTFEVTPHPGYNVPLNMNRGRFFVHARK